MKKRIIGATLITVVCALLISNLVGVLLFRSREMDAARNTLQELLVLMDAQSAITDPDGLAQQFHAAAPAGRRRSGQLCPPAKYPQGAHHIRKAAKPPTAMQ